MGRLGAPSCSIKQGDLTEMTHMYGMTGMTGISEVNGMNRMKVIYGLRL